MDENEFKVTLFCFNLFWCLYISDWGIRLENKLRDKIFLDWKKRRLFYCLSFKFLKYISQAYMENSQVIF